MHHVPGMIVETEATPFFYALEVCLAIGEVSPVHTVLSGEPQPIGTTNTPLVYAFAFVAQGL